MNGPIVAPSVLAADLSRLAEAAAMSEAASAPWLHLDIMDGRFVPNLTFGPPVVAALRRVSSLYFDVHLMIEEPERSLDAFIDAGADGLTVHWEACRHLHRTLEAIRAAGKAAGVAINPHTPAELLEPVLPELDLVLVMSVNPGFAGQRFLPLALPKLRWLAEVREREGHRYRIEVDGGVDTETAPSCRRAGADVFVAGSAVFRAGYDRNAVASAVRSLQEAVAETGTGGDRGE